MDITVERNAQLHSCLQDGDHTDGPYIKLFAEQLTRTFEVFVLTPLSGRSGPPNSNHKMMWLEPDLDSIIGHYVTQLVS